MAHPRRIVPGETYLITRRCYQRTLRLRPCTQTNRIFTYCLALAMQKTGVVLHAACVMSNHHHLVVTDPRGLLPDFLRELHRLTAKAMNAMQGESENLWAAEPCNVVRLTTDDDVEEKIGYVIANPVAAGLVKHPDQWPGFVAWGERSIRAERPAPYFRENGACPDFLVLELTKPVPRPVPSRREGEWRDRIGRAIAEAVAKAHQALEQTGRAFLGRGAVLASSFTRRALSYEERRGVVPTLAARQCSVRERLIRIERRFRALYRRALEQWRAGIRDVVFPFGTWAMRVFHGSDMEALAPT
jgi:putative transposase